MYCLNLLEVDIVYFDLGTLPIDRPLFGTYDCKWPIPAAWVSLLSTLM